MYPSISCPHCWVINVEALPLIPLTVSHFREIVILTESIRYLLASITEFLKKIQTLLTAKKKKYSI